jgi:hypothetical protein
MKPFVHNKCRDFLSKEILLLHNNARLHSEAATTEAIMQLKLQLKESALRKEYLRMVSSADRMC